MKKITFLIITVLGMTTIYGQELVAHYPFNGNANDESGSMNTHNGIVSNATLTSDRFGNPNSAYHFLASSESYIQVSHHNDLNFDSLDAISISVWINIDSTDATIDGIVTKWDHTTSGASEQYGLWATTNNDLIMVGRAIENGPTYTSGILNGTWHHIVSIYDKVNRLYKIYIDNSLFATTNGNTATYTHTSLNADIYIGAQDAGANVSRFFNGKIDDIHIFDYEISSTQVDSLYQLPNPTSINELNNEKTFSVYPNPVSNTLNIASQSAFSKINILDVNGKLIKSKNSNATTINVADLISGFYIIVLLDKNNQTIARQKFIKQ